MNDASVPGSPAPWQAHAISALAASVAPARSAISA
jgi:hypothetical protein